MPLANELALSAAMTTPSLILMDRSRISLGKRPARRVAAKPIPLAAALGLALMAMQAPAVTHEYQTALLQLVRSSEQEIAQR